MGKEAYLMKVQCVSKETGEVGITLHDVYDIIHLWSSIDAKNPVSTLRIRIKGKPMQPIDVDLFKYTVVITQEDKPDGHHD